MEPAMYNIAACATSIRPLISKAIHVVTKRTRSISGHDTMRELHASPNTQSTYKAASGIRLSDADTLRNSSGNGLQVPLVISVDTTLTKRDKPVEPETSEV